MVTTIGSDREMILNIDHLKSDPGTFEPYAFSFTPEGEDEDYELLAPVSVSGTVVYGGNTYQLSCHLSARIELPCSRCLTAVSQDMELDFDEEFDADEFPEEEAVIDIGDVAAQVWSTSIPMHALCAQDCKGLCQVCGKNLNEGDCGCPQTEADPRLEILRTLIDVQD